MRYLETGSRSASFFGCSCDFGTIGSAVLWWPATRKPNPAGALRIRCAAIIRSLVVVLLLAGFSAAAAAQGSIFSDGFESGGSCSWSATVPLIVYSQDLDNDGFGNPALTQEGCEPPPGFVADNTDCDDASGVTHPGAAPLDSPTLCMKDFDTDDFGDDGAGPFSPGSDCNDTDGLVNPDAIEVCDGVDNNCDGDVDEGLTNACGGCGSLPANPGDPCGTCGQWECLDLDDVMCVDSCVLVAFGPVPSFVRVGDMGVMTIPDPLLVILAGPSEGDTFVDVISADPVTLGVAGGGVTVANGMSSAPVLLDGLHQVTAVTLTASLAGVNLHANVRVVGREEPPTVAAITPGVLSIPVNESDVLDVVLDFPAGNSGVVVDLSLSPGSFGSVPPIAMIPADVLSVPVTFTAGAGVGTEVMTASIGTSTAEATINVIEAGSLVVNEVDYDQEGTDTLEFIEIFNGTASSLDLTNYSLVLVNGATNTEYLRIPLAPVSPLQAGEYLVIGSDALLATVPPAAKTIAFGAPTNNVQNGAPDGLALIDEAGAVVIDALSYEGAITAAAITGLGAVNLVEGIPDTRIRYRARLADSISQRHRQKRRGHGLDRHSVGDTGRGEFAVSGRDAWHW